MSRRCDITGKGVMTGNNVSHANNRTRRRFLPNLRAHRLYSETLGESIRLKISAHALRTVEQRGGPLRGLGDLGRRTAGGERARWRGARREPGSSSAPSLSWAGAAGSVGPASPGPPTRTSRPQPQKTATDKPPGHPDKARRAQKRTLANRVIHRMWRDEHARHASLATAA